MTTQLTDEQRLQRFDRSLEDLQRGFVEAVERLQQAPEVDGEWDARLRALSERLAGLRRELEPEDYDREQIVMLLDTLLEIRELLDRDGGRGSLDVCERLLIALERIRHVVRDALDEHIAGIAGDTSAVMGELERRLPGIPDRVIADLLGVDRRTLSRWKHRPGPPPRRTLRVFARVVAILRHSWDAEGVVAWFGRPRRDLDGRSPRALLEDPSAESLLVSAARSGRSQYAG